MIKIKLHSKTLGWFTVQEVETLSPEDCARWRKVAWEDQDLDTVTFDQYRVFDKITFSITYKQ